MPYNQVISRRCSTPVLTFSIARRRQRTGGILQRSDVGRVARTEIIDPDVVEDHGEWIEFEGEYLRHSLQDLLPFVFAEFGFGRTQDLKDEPDHVVRW